MKVNISKSDTQSMKDRYLSLQKDKAYCADFLLYQRLIRQMEPLSLANSEWGAAFFQMVNLHKKWGMRFLLNPKYKIKFQLKYTSIRPCSPIAKVIYSLDILQDPNLIRCIKKAAIVSDRKSAMDARIKKYFCYSIVKETKMSYSALGRVMSVDKNTVRNWVEEVGTWSGEERENAMAEMRTSKDHSKEMDALDYPGLSRTFYEETDEQIPED